MSSTSNWMHFHQNQTPPPPPSSTVHVSSSPPSTSPPTPTGPGQLGPEGRVSKTARRRTRASRRTPTTLLNTDTSNFRAMVQQFTGGPAFASQPVGSGHFSVMGPHVFGLSGLGPSHNVAGPGSGFGPPLGHPVQHGVINNSSSNNSNRNNYSSNHNNNNNSGNDLHGVGDLFTNSGGSSENAGSNINAGFQF